MVQRHQTRSNVSTGIRDPGLLAKWPLIGLCIFLLGSLIFGGLCYDLLAHGPLLKWDNVIAGTLPTIALHSPAYVQVLMDAGFYLGREVIVVLGVLFGLYFLYKRDWEELALLAIGSAGASLLFYTLTPLFHRARPPTQIWIVINLPGFPSGHAISSVVFYGLLAYLFVPKMPSAFWKVVVVAAAVIIIAFIGFTRIFTGGHYLTDILAGYAIGLAWCGMAYTLVEMYFQKRTNQYVEEV